MNIARRFRHKSDCLNFKRTLQVSTGACQAKCNKWCKAGAGVASLGFKLPGSLRACRGPMPSSTALAASFRNLGRAPSHKEGAPAQEVNLFEIPADLAACEASLPPCFFVFGPAPADPAQQCPSSINLGHLSVYAGRCRIGFALCSLVSAALIKRCWRTHPAASS